MTPIPTLTEIAERLVAAPPRVVADGPDWRMAGVAAVFQPGPDGPELLFILRAKNERDAWSGQVGFPGGKRDGADVTLEDTAVRETREEIGLDLRAVASCTALGPLDELQARSRKGLHRLAIRPYAFVIADGSEVPPLRPDQTEVSDAFWVPLRRLVDPACRVRYDAHRDGAPMQFPAVDLGPGRTLWGLTYRMVLDVLARLGVDGA